MAWEGSTRRQRLPADWPTIRATVLARDGYRCTHIHQGKPCGWRATDVDHIINNDDHSLTNLHALCSWHHARKTAHEGNTARWSAPRRTRPPEQHPGMT
jgi:5-methylcytosine-specific restriction endonuclease McrA